MADGLILELTESPNTEVYVYGNVLYESKLDIQRLGQQSYTTLDGAIVTFDKGVNQASGEIILSAVSQADKEALQDYILETINFSENSFTLTPINSLVDIGDGAGTPIPNCYFNRQDLNGIFERSPPGVYKVIFPYKWKL
jgi:hypothetical protein